MGHKGNLKRKKTHIYIYIILILIYAWSVSLWCKQPKDNAKIVAALVKTKTEIFAYIQDFAASSTTKQGQGQLQRDLQEQVPSNRLSLNQTGIKSGDSTKRKSEDKEKVSKINPSEQLYSKKSISLSLAHPTQKIYLILRWTLDSGPLWNNYFPYWKRSVDLLKTYLQTASLNRII